MGIFAVVLPILHAIIFIENNCQTIIKTIVN